MRRSIQWTFWPSLAVAIVVVSLGRPLLWLFGPEFVAGWTLLPVLAVGVVARATVGLAERLLNMLGQRTACALAYVAAFAVNLAACILSIPRFGPLGAAASVLMTLIVESILLFWISKLRLGLHTFVIGAAKSQTFSLRAASKDAVMVPLFGFGT